MREAMGQVKFNERDLESPLQRQVENSVRNWLQIHDLNREETDFEVAFFSEDTLAEISCLIVIKNGQQLWRSWETARDPQLAFNRSLEQLQSEIRH